jgi:hypothetical protein
MAQPTPALAANPVLSTEDQLVVLDALVDRVESVYVYPDYSGVAWPQLAADMRARVEAGLDTENFYRELETLVLALGDEHSYFEAPVQVAASEVEFAGMGDFVGIGVLVQPLSDKSRLTILASAGFVSRRNSWT